MKKYFYFIFLFYQNTVLFSKKVASEYWIRYIFIFRYFTHFVFILLLCTRHCDKPFSFLSSPVSFFYSPLGGSTGALVIGDAAVANSKARTTQISHVIGDLCPLSLIGIIILQAELGLDNEASLLYLLVRLNLERQTRWLRPSGAASMLAC